MQEYPFFPMFVDISDKKVVIIGGGRIARRRVFTLQKFAKDITVIAPELLEELQELAQSGKIRWYQGNYEPSLLDGADLVFAATNDAGCNEEIVRECKEWGILVNSAHKKELSDFYFPAVIVKDELVAGVTASGKNHQKAREARIKIEEVFEEF